MSEFASSGHRRVDKKQWVSNSLGGSIRVTSSCLYNRRRQVVATKKLLHLDAFAGARIPRAPGQAPPWSLGR